MKACKLCGQTKPLDAFHLKGGTKDGRMSQCRSCFNGRQRARRAGPDGDRLRARRVEYYQRNHGRIREAQAEYRERNRDQINAQARDWRSRNPEKKREYRLLDTYGMTNADYDAMLERQSYVCAICRLPPADGKRLFIDHCHESGCVRGLLCHSCNIMIGVGRDDPRTLRAAAAYLEQIEGERGPANVNC